LQFNKHLGIVFNAHLATISLQLDLANALPENHVLGTAKVG
jgi:hypothetical protein